MFQNELISYESFTYFSDCDGVAAHDLIQVYSHKIYFYTWSKDKAQSGLAGLIMSVAAF